MLDSITPVHESTEVIVVDNASVQDEASVIDSLYPDVKVIRSKSNLGFAGGNNLGIKEASGKYVFLVNNDTEFSIDNIEHLIRRLEKNPSIAAVSPKICFFYGERAIQYAGYTPMSKMTLRNKAVGFGETDNGQYDKSKPTPYLHGAAMMVRRSAIDAVGMMPECYFLYYEELDWSLMFRRMGYSLWYEPECTIYHKESQTTGSNSTLRTYYITRNRLLFARRNVAFPFFPLTILYLMCIVAPKDITIHLFNKRSDLAKAVLKGIFDFIRL